MSISEILISGATGYVGFRVLLTALEAGFAVRCVVRSQLKADEILANPTIKKLPTPPSLSFAIVPDFTVPGAFDRCVEGLEHVIHVASPIPGPTKTDWQRDLLEPAVKGTLELLKSAQKAGTIKRVVITSSVAGIVPYDVLTNGDPTDKIWTADDRIPVDQGPYENIVQVYNASKALALEAIRGFVEGENPTFGVINIFPGWVIGRNHMAHDPTSAVSGSNWAALGHVFGHHSTRATAPVVGHVDDVALAHIKALDPKVPGNQNFGVCFDSDWGEALTIVEKNFPRAVEQGIFPVNGRQPNVKIRFNARRTEDVLGFKFMGFESQVTSVAGHYLEELSRPGAKPVNPDLLQI